MLICDFSNSTYSLLFSSKLLLFSISSLNWVAKNLPVRTFPKVTALCAVCNDVKKVRKKKVNQLILLLFYLLFIYLIRYSDAKGYLMCSVGKYPRNKDLIILDLATSLVKKLMHKNFKRNDGKNQEWISASGLQGISRVLTNHYYFLKTLMPCLSEVKANFLSVLTEKRTRSVLISQLCWKNHNLEWLR